MAHHYAYMTKVAEVREPESYVEAAKDANWRVIGGRDAHLCGERNVGPGWCPKGCETNRM